MPTQFAPPYDNANLYRELAKMVGIVSKTFIAERIGTTVTRLNEGFNGGSVPRAKTAEPIRKLIAEITDERLGYPMLEWNSDEARMLVELQEKYAVLVSDSRHGVSDNELSDSNQARIFFRNAFERDGRYRDLILHASSVTGRTPDVTYQRIVLNLVAMHLARIYAVIACEEGFRTITSTASREAARRSLECARTAALLAKHIEKNQSKPFTDAQMRQLTVQRAYIRMNQIAVVSTFRKSLETVRTPFFTEQQVIDEIKITADVDIFQLLLGYKQGHPARRTTAANSLAIDSVMGSIAKAEIKQMEYARRAVGAWKILIEEEPTASDLATKLGTHERPLSHSPDLKWILEKNDGQTTPTPSSPIYEFIGKEH